MKLHHWFVVWAAWLMTTPSAAASDSVQRVDLDGQILLPELLVHETFSEPSWRNRWVIEGKGLVETRDGRLHVLTPAPTEASSGGVTVWLQDQLPAGVLIEFNAGSDSSTRPNATNLNLVVHATEPNGAPYMFGRTGEYSDYKRFPNYIFTLTGEFKGQPGHARVRRNPGFTLLSEQGAVHSTPGRTYHLRIDIWNGRLRYWLDGKLIHDVKDPRPLTGGRLGLRTWNSNVWWSDVHIYRLDPVNSNRNLSR